MIAQSRDGFSELLREELRSTFMTASGYPDQDHD
jgi:hypothetical protein